MDFNAVCRTCLATKELNPIFAGTVHDKRYSATVFVTTGIKVYIDDGLPQQMCARCISFSNASLKFRKQSKDAETRLLQVKQECDGAAETLYSGSVDSEDLNDKEMRLELKIEEDNETDDGGVSVKSEDDIEVEDNGFGALNTMEEDPLEVKPVGGIGAAPERARARPGEGPSCNTSHQQQLQLRSCFVRLERFPIEDLRRNLHTCETCLMTFDCDSSLKNHRCTNAVESNLNKVCDETKIHFDCDICGKEFVKKRHIIRHLAHNAQLGSEKRVPYSPDYARFANTQEISNSDNVSKTRFRIQPALAILTTEKFGRHTCDVSSKELPQKQNLIRHIRKLHRNDIGNNSTNKYICNVCKKRFRFQSQLTRHMPTHSGEKLFSCEICKKGFARKGVLSRHMRIHTGEKPYTCDVCKKPFSRLSHLTLHKRTHTGAKPYCCRVCNKRFTQRSHLTTHMHTHTGEKLFSCDICKKEFAGKGDLSSHMRTHTGEKPFICDVCKKPFRHQSNLRIHKRTHTGEKPFSCSVCNKRFSQRPNLTRHMHTHTGAKLYSCDVCEKKFTQRSHVTTHLGMHTGKKPLACNMCGKQFTDKINLVKHIQIHSGEKLFAVPVASSSHEKHV